MNIAELTARAKLLAPVIKEYVQAELSNTDKKINSIESDLINKVDAIVNQAIIKACDAIELPKDGKDALQIEVMPEIDQAHSYEPGTFAQHRGGLWRSYAPTQAMQGWVCLVDGIDEIDFSVSECGRHHQLSINLSSGKSIKKSFKNNNAIYRGVFRDNEKYSSGDMVTRSGSVWYCKQDTEKTPGDSEHWQLAVKRGGKE